MFLFELGDRSVKVKTIRNDDRVFDAEAKIGNRQILFSAVKMGHSLPYWNVVFSEETWNEDNEEWVGSVEATGSGNQFEVLSMIMSCMKTLLKKNPEEVRFSASKGGDDSSRANIYRKLGQKIFKGYDVEEIDNGYEVDFKYTKQTKGEV
jgi:hypothetical protein